MNTLAGLLSTLVVAAASNHQDANWANVKLLLEDGYVSLN